MSQASRGSKASIKRSLAGSAANKAPSIATSEANKSIDEEDEWTAIQKFNALLHYQESKQAKERADKRRELMCNELAN